MRNLDIHLKISPFSSLLAKVLPPADSFHACAKELNHIISNSELVIIDNWWFPAFMIGNENLLFMNMHKSNYYDKVIERINNKYGFQASLFIKQVFEKVTSDSESEEYVYWDHIAQENMYEDFTINNQIRTYLNIESENILDINEKDTWSAVRLCLFERFI